MKNEKKKLQKMYKAFAVLAVASMTLVVPDVAMAVTDLATMGTQSQTQGKGGAQIIKWVGLVGGLGFVLASLFMASAASKPQAQITWKPVIIIFLVGSAMLSIGAVATIGSNTVLGTASTATTSLNNLGV